MTWIAAIESKSKNLISAAREVTELIGKAVEIDVDKVALSTLLVNLPSIVEKTITTVSGDTEMANRVTVTLNNQINELMIALRLNKEEILPAQHQSSESGITFDQFQQMFDSVPSQPNGLTYDSH